MNNINSEKIYYAAVYVRLSHEDGDVSRAVKDESDSISNQKSLIQHFISKQQNMELVEIFEDDGYSGVFFDNRPGFLRMLEAVEEGRVNTVVVKDLSRLGRNYVEVGRTVEDFLDVYGIRLISINDNVDTVDGDEKVRDIIIPFYNIVYEQYARDTSGKTRSALDVKCKSGQFIGSYAPFGYKKSEENKNKLVVDEQIAPTVQLIFKSYIEGMSAQSIANMLEGMHIPTPMDAKREQGVRCGNGFKTYKKSTWDVSMINRILRNEVYIGHLVQGKVSKKNFKQKKRYTKAEDKWIRYENAHESIINEMDFEIVQQLLQEDTRRANAEEILSPLAGKVYCGDCGETMHRRKVKAKDRYYNYYRCSAHKRDKMVCTQHNIAEDILLKAVEESIRLQIQLLREVEPVLAYCRQQWDRKRSVENLEIQRRELEELLSVQMDRIQSLYEDVKDGLITKEEYFDYKLGYQQKAVEIRERLVQLDEKRKNREVVLDDTEWMERFQAYENEGALTRVMVAQLVKAIYVYEDKRIRIVFNYHNQLEELKELIEECNVQIPKEVAV